MYQFKLRKSKINLTSWISPFDNKYFVTWSSLFACLLCDQIATKHLLWKQIFFITINNWCWLITSDRSSIFGWIHNFYSTLEAVNTIFTEISFATSPSKYLCFNYTVRCRQVFGDLKCFLSSRGDVSFRCLDPIFLPSTQMKTLFNITLTPLTLSNPNDRYSWMDKRRWAAPIILLTNILDFWNRKVEKN